MVHKFKQKVIHAPGAQLERKNRKMMVSTAGGKIGGAAGFTVNAANNTPLATVAPSQTGAKYVLPVTGLQVGDQITGFHLTGSLDSAGGAITVDADLRKSTAVAGSTPTDASIGTITQVAVTAQTKLDAANSTKDFTTPEVVAGDTQYYIVVTVTTAASTNVLLNGAGIKLTQE